MDIAKSQTTPQTRTLLAIRFDPYTVALGRAIARRRGVSMSAVVRTALAEWLSESEQRATLGVLREALAREDLDGEPGFVTLAEALDRV